MEKKIAYYSICVFLVGLITTIIADFSIENIEFYLRKLSFIVFLPVLLILLKPQENKKVALYGLLIGLIISLLYALYLFIDSGGFNISPFWDIGRWRELLAYSILFMFPFLFSKKRQYQRLSTILLAVSFFILFLTSGRAAYLVLIIIIPCYIIIFQRQAFLKSLIVVILLVGSLFLFPNKISNNLIHRTESISNTRTDRSNLARLEMWSVGFKFFKYNLQQSPVKALCGMGDSKSETLFKKYLAQTGRLEVILIKSAGEFSFNDHHNAYLNTLNKQGLIFFIVFYGLLLYMFKHSFRLAITGDKLAQSSLLVLTAYLLIGMFYSNQNGFQPTMLIFLWAISVVIPHKMETSVVIDR